MELWDIYDADRNRTGRVMVRGDAFKEGDYHLVVHVCIFNQKGEMLIQQRQPFKQGWSNLWDITVGGSAVAGDSSQTAIARELEEELGLTVSFAGIRPHLTLFHTNGFDDIYLLQKEVELDKLTLQVEEVQAVRWASQEEIFTMIDSKEFIPYHKSLIALFFDMKNQYGAHQQK
ncbi:NUDIX hydrolase [Scatolibacter rhodanostii]|uniref:NUDIX hydrolase n=1 Tax=Scatolibacter rhodanostii TaxID=2014781 RepID=UPI000C07B77B|nr:NUDIX domain-containing protein [Scatolibacter rhodanostii]